MTDRLAEIKTRVVRADTEPDYDHEHSVWYSEDVPWLVETVERLVRQKGQAWDVADKYGMRELELVGEVEQLRAEVAEWKQAAGAEADLADERGREVARLRGLLGRLEWGKWGGECPACGASGFMSEPKRDDHHPGCWLAAELAHNANDPPPPK
jgi:hypothetical protein